MCALRTHDVHTHTHTRHTHTSHTHVTHTHTRHTHMHTHTHTRAHTRAHTHRYRSEDQPAPGASTCPDTSLIGACTHAYTRTLTYADCLSQGHTCAALVHVHSHIMCTHYAYTVECTSHTCVCWRGATCSKGPHSHTQSHIHEGTQIHNLAHTDVEVKSISMP